MILFPALVLAGTLRFGFVFDDNVVILGDPLVVSQFNPKEIFGSEVRVADIALGYYRPLITLLYRMDRALWGLNPAGYHLTNLVWHLLATLLVYQLALRTTGQLVAAWTGAMLFSVLPAHTEAIGWIQGRVDLVSTTFALLALLALVRAPAQKGPAGWLWDGLAGLAFLAALLAKESAAALPLAWCVWEVSASGTGARRERLVPLARRFVPLGLAGLAYMQLRWWAVGASFSFFRMSVSQVALRVLALLSILSEYGRILLFPDLTLNFHQTLMVSLTPRTLAAGLAVVVVLGGGLAITWGRIRPLFPWAAWMPIMLLPASVFILQRTAPETGFFTAERFLYLPSVGWCILLGSLIAPVIAGRGKAQSPSWGLMIFCGTLLGYTGLTLIRLQPWADPAELYVAMKAQANMPTAARVLVHNNLGEVYLERGEMTAARQEFQAALRLKPDYALGHNNLGVLLLREGQPAQARLWLEKAIRLAPDYGEAYGNLGAAYEALGDLSAARQSFERGLRVAPHSAFLARGLARVNVESARPPVPQAGV
ncbi:MAG TPA: tetratricopeptide repeat protein, partial [Candidatus Methylomirabilis sp.]|nr:tetratricopeptide repeat protein [Candidatus Methylomirabilis sp.]